MIDSVRVSNVILSDVIQLCLVLTRHEMCVTFNLFAGREGGREGRNLREKLTPCTLADWYSLSSGLPANTKRVKGRSKFMLH